jgi:hypothetical protein
MRTFTFCRKKGRLIPDWVLKRFDEVAVRLMAKVPMGKGKAKSMPGRRSVWLHGGPGTAHLRHFEAVQRRQAVLQVVEMLCKDPKMSIDDACEKVAGGFRVGYTTVKRWYYDLLPSAKKLAKAPPLR